MRAWMVSLFFPLALAVQAATEAEWRGAYIDQNVLLTEAGMGRPDGFKAGLTSEASRQRFHSDRSVSGNLPAGSQLESAAVSLTDFGKGMLEVELAFRLREAPRRPLVSTEELKALVTEVALALELPDLQRIPAPLSALNIVRGNVAARYFAVAAPVSATAVELETLPLRLMKDGVPLMTANAGMLADGQWQSLLLLINQRMAMGWEVGADQWLLTGALGGMRPLQLGHYLLQAQGLPSLSLRVEE